MNKVENRSLVLTVAQAKAIYKVAIAVTAFLLLGVDIIGMLALNSSMDGAPAMWRVAIGVGFLVMVTLLYWWALASVVEFLKVSVPNPEPEQK